MCITHITHRISPTKSPIPSLKNDFWIKNLQVSNICYIFAPTIKAILKRKNHGFSVRSHMVMQVTRKIAEMLQNCQMPTPILPRNPVRNITKNFSNYIWLIHISMRKLSIISNNKLTSGLEIFLAVGNMGDTIMYLLPSNEALVYSPRQKFSIIYMPFSQNVRRDFLYVQ